MNVIVMTGIGIGIIIGNIGMTVKKEIVDTTGITEVADMEIDTKEEGQEMTGMNYIMKEDLRIGIDVVTEGDKRKRRKER